MNGSRPVTNSLRHGPQTLLMTGSFALRIQKPKFQSSYPSYPELFFSILWAVYRSFVTVFVFRKVRKESPVMRRIFSILCVDIRPSQKSTKKRPFVRYMRFIPRVLRPKTKDDDGRYPTNGGSRPSHVTKSHTSTASTFTVSWERSSTILVAFTTPPLSPKYLVLIKLQCSEPTIHSCKPFTYSLTSLSTTRSPHDGTRA